MSDPTAEMYRREADRILSEITVVNDPDTQASLLHMARQYLKLAELHEGR
jgi:hypothetical protein